MALITYAVPLVFVSALLSIKDALTRYPLALFSHKALLCFPSWAFKLWVFYFAQLRGMANTFVSSKFMFIVRTYKGDLSTYGYGLSVV